MKICVFHLMPYRFLPDDFERTYRSVWVDVPHGFHDPEKTAGLTPLGLWRDDAPVADVVVLPIDELVQVLWRDPGSEAATQWAMLPELDADNVAAQIESVQRRAAMAKFVWPIPDKGIKKRLHRIESPRATAGAVAEFLA